MVKTQSLILVLVIAITANAMAEHRQEALDGGCDEYETKPVRLPSLLEKIEHFT